MLLTKNGFNRAHGVYPDPSGKKLVSAFGASHSRTSSRKEDRWMAAVEEVTLRPS
jgi:hypothetical protein